jgi:hypothetical protein
MPLEEPDRTDGDENNYQPNSYERTRRVATLSFGRDHLCVSWRGCISFYRCRFVVSRAGYALILHLVCTPLCGMARGFNPGVNWNSRVGGSFVQ